MRKKFKILKIGPAAVNFWWALFKPSSQMHESIKHNLEIDQMHVIGRCRDITNRCYRRRWQPRCLPWSTSLCPEVATPAALHQSQQLSVYVHKYTSRWQLDYINDTTHNENCCLYGGPKYITFFTMYGSSGKPLQSGGTHHFSLVGVRGSGPLNRARINLK